MRTTIYLVHGTWPRGLPCPKVVKNVIAGLAVVAKLLRFGKSKTASPFWFESGSLFRSKLSEALQDEHEYIQLDWSGKNTLRARFEAAEGLRCLLRDGFKRNPDGRHVVVAHSHGGNVAMYSLGSLEKKYMPHGIATLATPFLELQKRKRARVDHFLNYIIIAILFLMWIFLVTTSFNLNFALGLLVFWGTPIAILKFLHTRQGRKRVFRRSIFHAAFHRRSRLFRSGRPSLLIIRANNDEASGVLAMTYMVGAMNQKAWATALLVVNGCLSIANLVYSVTVSAFSIWMNLILVIGAIAALVVWAIGESRATEMLTKTWPVSEISRSLGLFYLPLHSATRSDIRVWVVATIAVFGLVAGSSVLLLLMFQFIGRFLLVPFGAELFLVSDKLVSRVNASPTGIVSKVLVVPDQEVAGGMRHAVYRSNLAHAQLSLWIHSIEVPFIERPPLA